MAPAFCTEDAEDISQIFEQRKKYDPKLAVWILRLLFDRRRRNERERHRHAASRSKPHAACFLDIILDDCEHIESDTSELECFYYTFLVSAKRALRNVFGRPLRASLFADFACYRPEFAGRMVVPALASLAIGRRILVTMRRRRIVSSVYEPALWILLARCITACQYLARGRCTGC